MDTEILYITVLCSIFIAIILIYFFVSIVRYHRRYLKLQKERTNAEITIQENERKRIANDLHDSIGPMLSAVKMNINCIDTHTPEDEKVIQKSGGYIDEIITNLRRISYNLLPNTLERKGFIEALTEYVDNMKDKAPLDIQLNVLDTVEIPADRSVHIFRILQEIIHNTVKHSRASTLTIQITRKNNFLQVTTKDDGVGFDTQVVRNESSGLGLKSINSRADMLDGRLDMESASGKGTMYVLKIPV